MTERQALLLAVCAEPAEDTPRLAFADWLDENGDEVDRAWAAYIRSEIAGGPESVRFTPELGEAVGVRAWPCELMPNEMGAVLDWRRGFPDWLHITQSAFKPHAKHVFKRCPLTTVNLLGRQPRAVGVQTWVWWARRDGQLPAERAEPSPVLFNELRHWLKANRNPKQCRSSQHRLHSFTYRTLASARADLSAACVRYGRWLAGLPQLDGLQVARATAEDRDAGGLFAGVE